MDNCRKIVAKLCGRNGLRLCNGDTTQTRPNMARAQIRVARRCLSLCPATRRVHHQCSVANPLVSVTCLSEGP